MWTRQKQKSCVVTSVNKSESCLSCLPHFLQILATRGCSKKQLQSYLINFTEYNLQPQTENRVWKTCALPCKVTSWRSQVCLQSTINNSKKGQPLTELIVPNSLYSTSTTLDIFNHTPHWVAIVMVLYRFNQILHRCGGQLLITVTPGDHTLIFLNERLRKKIYS